LAVSSEVFADKVEKELGRKLNIPKKTGRKIDDFKAEDYADIRILVYTQPKLAGVGKKMPEVFEMGIGGKMQDRLAYAKNVLGRELRVGDFAKEGSVVDVHSVTKGKGVQGPVRRFGVSLRSHKSEKAVRNPGNVGPWTGPASWRVAHAGKTGFNQRTEYNKWVVRIGDDPKDVSPKGGFTHYGAMKTQYMLIKGSLPGPSRRLVIMSDARRASKGISKEAPSIVYIDVEAKK
jgi:large subunit ribosomal protein L3